jgi:hypothetical protein
MPPSEPPAAPETGSRLRLAFAVAAAAALGAVVMLVLVAGSGSGDSADGAPAPAQCVRAWNQDPSTVAFGVHNATAHGYSQVQVTRLAEDGSALAGTDAGKCAVVFAATSLDPELGAAAQIRINGGWAPLTATGVDTARLAQLQSDAVEQANADLQPDGTIVAR